jgi:ubiquinone/menaquinone biosynthesis C-methylase UbiE
MSQWNGILREDSYSPEEPDDTVIEFAVLLKKKNNHARVLDLGCGAGRHLVYAARQGFEAYGMDISETGLNLTKKRLRSQKLDAHLVKSDMKKLPYIDSCFDAVICLHTVYHQELVEIRGAICEINRVLSKKGYLLMNFLSKRTYSCGKGVRVEGGTFMEQEGVEKGVLHHFVDREEIESLLGSFKIVDLKMKESEVDGKLRSRWIVLAMG